MEKAKPFLRPTSDLWTKNIVTEPEFYQLYNEVLDRMIDEKYPISEDLIDKIKFRATLKNRLSKTQASYILMGVYERIMKMHNVSSSEELFNK